MHNNPEGSEVLLRKEDGKSEGLVAEGVFVSRGPTTSDMTFKLNISFQAAKMGVTFFDFSLSRLWIDPKSLRNRVGMLNWRPFGPSSRVRVMSTHEKSGGSSSGK